MYKLIVVEFDVVKWVAETFEIDVSGGEYCMKKIMLRKMFDISTTWNDSLVERTLRYINGGE